MESIRKYFQKDKFAGNAGVELLEVSKGRAKAKMEIKDIHRNSIGIVHGAAIFTLADFTFGVAANSHGTIAVAINVNISYMKAAKSGTLVAEAREVSINPRLGTYTVDVVDDDGDLVAIFQGLAYRKRDKIDISDI